MSFTLRGTHIQRKDEKNTASQNAANSVWIIEQIHLDQFQPWTHRHCNIINSYFSQWWSQHVSLISQKLSCLNGLLLNFKSLFFVFHQDIHDYHVLRFDCLLFSSFSWVFSVGCVFRWPPFIIQPHCAGPWEWREVFCIADGPPWQSWHRGRRGAAPQLKRPRELTPPSEDFSESK